MSRPLRDDLAPERRGYLARSPERGLAFAAIALTLIGVAGAGTYFFFGLENTAHREENTNQVGTTTVTNADMPTTDTTTPPPEPAPTPAPATSPADLPWAPPVVQAVKEPNLPREMVAPQIPPAERTTTTPQPAPTTNYAANPDENTITPPPIQQQLPSAGNADVTTHMTPDQDENTMHNPSGEPALRRASSSSSCYRLTAIMQHELVVRPIGFVRSAFAEKVEAPRQGVVAEDEPAFIEVLTEYRDGLADLAGFSRIWILFWFDRAAPTAALKVLPPRSDVKRGVFATRSPHRPNPIGMTAARLERVDGLHLHIREHDLVDGTPVLDLKPYLAYADAFPDASGGWIAEDPRAAWDVSFEPDAEAHVAWIEAETGFDLRARVVAAMALGPQPHAYRRIKGDVLAVKAWRVTFSRGRSGATHRHCSGSDGLSRKGPRERDRSRPRRPSRLRRSIRLRYPRVMDLERSAVLVLDEIVRRAVRAKASDIHLEPKRDRLNVRFRVDGELVEEQSVPIDIALEVVSRVKVLARMDIAEKRVPQDGQLTLTPIKDTVHLRASTYPSSLGEKMVLRILGGQSIIGFDHIGLDPDTQKVLRELVDRPQGFIVASGPTGAGKTSTLYSCIGLLDTRRVNVITLEDPIEIEMASITQGQTNVKAGFTFASASARSCAKIPTSSWSARSATPRRRASRSRPRSPAIRCSRACTRTTRSTASSASSISASSRGSSAMRSQPCSRSASFARPARPARRRTSSRSRSSRTTSTSSPKARPSFARAAATIASARVIAAAPASSRSSSSTTTCAN